MMKTKLAGLICVGTSTGGPRALQQILSNIPATLPAAVLVVQHMPPGFTRSLAERLDSVCPLNVKEAADGDIVQGGTVYIAPGNRHMTVKQRRSHFYISLDDSPAVSGHRPSVDRLFLSLIDIRSIPKMLILLTGMGRDGAHGMKALKQVDPTVQTVAQDETSSVVYGMPRAAVLTGSVDDVVPLSGMAHKIRQTVNKWSVGGNRNE